MTASEASVARQSRDWGLLALRLVVLLNVTLALNYLAWRYWGSVHWTHWFIAVPLLVAETYSILDTCLFSLTAWRARRRPTPPAPPEGWSVDVFITCYNEPVELVRGTVRAARAIRYPHRTWLLDDGTSAEMAAMADQEGAGYIVRSEDWTGRQRHAKAGNLNNALLRTDGEFILILDADQIPRPQILDRTLGYFHDPSLAFVQTPQVFYNVPPHDPLGTQAPLFYGPIMKGKDGWNAAFFCGSNAVLRREALMQLGVRRYVVELEQRVRRALRTSDRLLKRARVEALQVDTGIRAELLVSIDALRRIVDEGRAGLQRGSPIPDVTWAIQEQARAVSLTLVSADLARLRAELDDIPGVDARDIEGSLGAMLADDVALRALTERAASPLTAVASVRALLEALDLDRPDEAQAVMPLSTISVTEDMATAMRLHGLGWRSLYHHELLADGLAPEDLRSALQQRLRWAQGTLQVFFRENPFLQRGLSWSQRLMYFSTMATYFSGFATVVYLAAPFLFMTFGWKPVSAYSWPFFLRLVPFLVVNQLLFQLAAGRVPKWRGQQYSLALFPLWITAVWGTVCNVYFGRALPFVVTPKTRQAAAGMQWRLVRWQILAICALAVAAMWGVARVILGVTDEYAGIMVNLLWIGYDLAALSVVIVALRYRPDGGQIAAWAMDARAGAEGPGRMGAGSG